MESFDLVDLAEFAGGTDHGHARVVFADQSSRTLIFVAVLQGTPHASSDHEAVRG